MDFLLALATALSPISPAADKRSSSDELPIDKAAGEFAAHMVLADGFAGMVLAGEHGRASGQPVGPQPGAGATGKLPVPTTPILDASDRVPENAAAVAAEQVQASAAVIIAELASGEAPEDQATAVILPVEAAAAARPPAAEPDAAGGAAGPEPERTIAAAAPAPLVPAAAADDAGAPGAGQPAQPEAAPAPPGVVPATAVRPASSAAAEAGAGDAVRVEPGAPAPPAVSATEVSGAAEPAGERQPPPDGEPARAVEPGRKIAPRERADEGLLQKGPVASDEQPAPPSPRIAATAGQPAGDAQPGRLLQLAPGAIAAGGLSGEVVQVGGRALDGAAGVEPVRQPAIQQVALEITRAVDQDRTEIRIRLDPPELGEVDIHLEFRDLRLTASVTAERQDTLDLLQRDARALARALREAGLDCADADLSFAHDGAHDGRNQRDAGAYGQRPIGRMHPLPAALLPDLPALAAPGGLVSLSDGRLDLRV